MSAELLCRASLCLSIVSSEPSFRSGHQKTCGHCHQASAGPCCGSLTSVSCSAVCGGCGCWRVLRLVLRSLALSLLRLALLGLLRLAPVLLLALLPKCCREAGHSFCHRASLGGRRSLERGLKAQMTHRVVTGDPLEIFEGSGGVHVWSSQGDSTVRTWAKGCFTSVPTFEGFLGGVDELAKV